MRDKKLSILGCIIILSAIGAATTQPCPITAMTDEEIAGAIDSLTEAKNLDGLIQLSKSIKSAFGMTDPSRYAYLTLRICNEMSTYKFNTDRQYIAASELAQNVLEAAPDMPIDVAVLFADHLNCMAELTNPVFPALRDRQADLWLTTYSRLLNASDVLPDPAYRPILNPVLPGFEDLPSGIDPSAIKDPNRRATYIAAMAENNRKAQVYFNHQRLQGLLLTQKPLMIRFFASAYAEPPSNREGLLAKLMKKNNAIGDGLRDAVMAAYDERTAVK